MLPRPDPARHHTPRRWIGSLVGSAIMVGLAVALVTTVSSVDRTGMTPGDPEVELGRDAPTLGAPLSDDEEAAVRRQVDPDRLRCEPRGCEVWWRGRDSARPNGVAATSDQAVLLQGDRLVAFDPASSIERWSVEFDTAPQAATVQSRWAGGWGMLSPGPDGSVVIVARDTVMVFASDGTEMWRTPDTTPTIRDASVLDEVIVVQSASRFADGTMQLIGLDLRTGAELWRSTALVVRSIDDDLVLVTALGRESVRALDPRSGATMWEREIVRGGRTDPAGPWIAFPHPEGSVLVDRITGVELASKLDGWLLNPPTEANGLWLATVNSILGWPTDEHPRRLLALDADGVSVWERPLDAPSASRCCPVLVASDGLTANVVDASGEYRIDAATGEVISASDASGDVRGIGIWHGDDGLYAEWTDTGLILRTSDGGRVEVLQPGGVWVESLDPLVVGSRGQLLGIRPVADG